jgi:hypothetical protein
MAYKNKFDGSTDTTVTLGSENSPTQIEGYFLGSKTTPDKGYGPGKLHVFQTEKGTVGVWGKTRLNNLLTSDLVGQMVFVEFTGMIAPKTKGRRPSYGFSVKHDPENTIDTTSINLSAPSEEIEEETENEAQEELHRYSQPETSFKGPTASKTAAVSPSAERSARVQALLSGKKLA